VRTGELRRHVGRAVLALVVDEHDAERAGVVPVEQRAQRLGQHVGLVARGDHRHDGRPACGYRPTPVEALVAEPEAAVREDEMTPGGERERGEYGEHGHGGRL
jgi:hypothetical protein